VSRWTGGNPSAGTVQGVRNRTVVKLWPRYGRSYRGSAAPRSVPDAINRAAAQHSRNQGRWVAYQYCHRAGGKIDGLDCL
jgi:hypothetical protein